jgi:DNA mismatch repair protein MutL
MSKIKLLPQNLINLIAAGEVVERPSSALKELLENSIDAKATKIVVNLKDYGNELIEIIDDGVGMDREDAVLAFKQHATSKISSEGDLQKIHTMGFRGEALASISAVAEHIILQTKTTKTEGVKVKITGTQHNHEPSTQSDPGTTISIHQIFQNIPARKKFLKSNAVELKHLTETFLGIALSHPHIHFELNHNGKQIYRLTKTDDLLHRIFEVWGKNIAKNIFKTNKYESNGVSIYGFLGNSEIGKKTGNLQYIFVNNRPVQNKIVAAAILEAYRGFIHRDLKPTFFMFIDLSPELVDVNIHPRKNEVRFINGQEIYRLVFSLTRKTLESSTKQKLSESIADHESNINNFSNTPSVMPTNAQLPHINEPQFVARDNANRTYSFKEKSPKEEIQKAMTFTQSLLEKESAADFLKDDLTVNDIPVFEPKKFFQLFNTYIVFEKEDKLVFLDQHASAEKILFERLYNKMGKAITKPLLIPEILEFRSEEKEVLLEKADELKDVGFIIDDFGQNSIQILEIPESVNKIDLHSYLKEIINEDNELIKGYEKDQEDYSNLSQEQYMMLATAACHGSIRAGQPLTPEEMISIIKDLLTLKNPYNCPHGRPVIWELERSEIEKGFRRRV